MDRPTVLVVNPNTSDGMTAAIDRGARATAGLWADVVTIRSRRGPPSIETALDGALGTAGMLEAVAAHPARFDVVVVAGFSDPGLDALRDLVRVPVIGIGAATFRQAGAIARRFALVTSSAGDPAHYAGVAAALGLSRRFLGTFPLALSVTELRAEAPGVLDRVTARVTEAVRAGADCVAFSHGGLSEHAAAIARQVGVPCVGSVAAGVSEALACLVHPGIGRDGSPFARTPGKTLEGYPGLAAHYGETC